MPEVFFNEHKNDLSNYIKQVMKDKYPDNAIEFFIRMYVELFLSPPRRGRTDNRLATALTACKEYPDVTKALIDYKEKCDAKRKEV